MGGGVSEWVGEWVGGWLGGWVSEGGGRGGRGSGGGLYLSIVTTFSNTTDLPWDPLNKMQVDTQSDKYNVIKTKFRCIRIDSAIRSWVFLTRKSKCLTLKSAHRGHTWG